ncbi:MAG: PhzF family phenazine biosynthesis protein, partial [Verrucomicrobiota bacterium]
ALENQLSETAFFVREDDHYFLRWFTPTVEVDLCGHATLASAYVLLAELKWETERVVFQSRSGKLIVEELEDGYRMDFPKDEIVKVEDNGVSAALGAEVTELYKGRHDFLAVLSGESGVRDLEPDFRKVEALEARGILATASAEGPELDFVSRCFFPQSGIDEDPVTGSAHTTMAPFWGERLDKTMLSAAQISERGGKVHCELAGDRVLLTGRAVTFLRGEFEIPAGDS